MKIHQHGPTVAILANSFDGTILSAKCTFVHPAFFAVLPADGANPVIVVPTCGIAKQAIFIRIITMTVHTRAGEKNAAVLDF
jgi:hypothetical protein